MNKILLFKTTLFVTQWILIFNVNVYMENRKLYYPSLSIKTNFVHSVLKILTHFNKMARLQTRVSHVPRDLPVQETILLSKFKTVIGVTNLTVA